MLGAVAARTVTVPPGSSATPVAIVDLKAAVRYPRHNDATMAKPTRADERTVRIE